MQKYGQNAPPIDYSRLSHDKPADVLAGIQNLQEQALDAFSEDQKQFLKKLVEQMADALPKPDDYRFQEEALDIIGDLVVIDREILNFVKANILLRDIINNAGVSDANSSGFQTPGVSPYKSPGKLSRLESGALAGSSSRPRVALLNFNDFSDSPKKVVNQSTVDEKSHLVVDVERGSNEAQIAHKETVPQRGIKKIVAGSLAIGCLLGTILTAAVASILYISMPKD